MKAKRPRRRVFQRRTGDDSPPGYDVIPGAITPEEAFATMEARLEDALGLLPEGYEGRITAHTYADGSVDAELYVVVPDGYDTRTAEYDLYESFTNIAVGQRYWVSFGARYEVKTDDERYRRHKGMTLVQTNYQRANSANIAEEHLLARHKVLTGMEKKFGEEAHDVFVRLHWNPENIQPKR